MRSGASRDWHGRMSWVQGCCVEAGKGVGGMVGGPTHAFPLLNPAAATHAQAANNPHAMRQRYRRLKLSSGMQNIDQGECGCMACLWLFFSSGCVGTVPSACLVRSKSLRAPKCCPA